MNLEKIIKWGDKYRNGDDPMEFYKENYFGVSRKLLEKLDQDLYAKIEEEDLLKNIPTKNDFGNDSYKFYKKYFDGKTRSEILEISFPLYNRLRRDGKIDKIPKKQSGKYGNLLDYYKEHYAGLTRNEVNEKNHSLSVLLHRKGLIKYVPAKFHENGRKYRNNLVGFYKKNYDGLTRRELSKTDPSFYKKLRKDDLLEFIPK